MGPEIVVFVGVGTVCSAIANLPVLVQSRHARGLSLSNRRLAGLLVAQTVLFGGYGFLLAWLHQQRHVTSVTQAALFGGVFGLVAVLFGSGRSRSLVRSISLGLAIVACSVAAFVFAPIVRNS